MSLLPQYIDDSPALPGQHPSRQGPSTPPPTSAKPWATRPHTFRDVIKNLMDIERRLAELDRRINHDDVMRAYDFANATQVADHTANILADVSQFDDPRKLEIFKMVARATFCNPRVMCNMAMATNIEEFCRAVPTHLHPSCGLCGAVRRKIEEQPIQDPDRSRSWSQRINDAVINAANLGIKFE